KKADDKKADDKKADDKKADDKKADDKKADDKKADDKKADDKKADDKKAEPKEVEVPSQGRSNLWGGSRSTKNSKKSSEFVEVFESVVASANESTLPIMSGKRQIALGTVVSSDGLVLTKASELRGDLGCQLNDGEIISAQVIGVDPKTDLALLKLETSDLNVIQWADDLSPPLMGRWVATPKAERRTKPTVGVVSVNAREIPPSRPFIGIYMEDVEDEDGIRISRIINKSPADLADLRVNDVILKLDGELVKDRMFLQKALGQYDINDRVTLVVRRGGKQIDIKLTLAERDKVSPDNSRSNTQNSMGSVLSRRRKDFPMSFQHDSMLSSSTCGGPIVDLSGKAVGINIARAGRVASLALTADVVLPILEKLKTGQYSPAVVNKVKIDQLSADLDEMVGKIGTLPAKKNVLERKYNVERARREEIQKTIRELEARLKAATAKEAVQKTELDDVRTRLRFLEKSKGRLEDDLKKLRLGSR
ncbi:MAG: PDZ domain-containing protein, partial [Mariniblastus sp.]|nr:PDZ domain-containing protein [Mariniblastus sp.]